MTATSLVLVDMGVVSVFGLSSECAVITQRATVATQDNNVSFMAHRLPCARRDVKAGVGESVARHAPACAEVPAQKCDTESRQGVTGETLRVVKSG
jgi:hypothetical protein